MAKSEEKAREMRETGERLKIARKARDMTQEHLADAAKVDQTAVSKAERGKFHLEDPTLGRLADALGVTLAWLRHGEGSDLLRVRLRMSSGQRPPRRKAPCDV